MSDSGVVIKKTGHGTEHRVNFKNGREATAYYTDDKDDAHATAAHMAKNIMKEHEHPYWSKK